MESAEPRWHRIAAALADRLDGVQIADLLWMAQQLAAEIEHRPQAEPDLPAGLKSEPAVPAATAPAAAKSALEAKDGDQASTASSKGPQPPGPEALLEPVTGAGAPPADGTPTVSVTEAGLLQRQRRRIGRALAPLNRQVESGPARLLDVRATVDTIARARVDRSSWLPVLRPRPEPWLTLHLVFDDHPSMALWQQLRRELPRTLAQQVRWRDLRCWRLSRAETGELELLGAHARRCSPRQLRRPGGRDVVVVVSDAVAPCWRDGAMALRLGEWASQVPVLLLQVLPPRLWPRTGLGQQEPGWVLARRPLQLNGTLNWLPAESDPFAEPEADGPLASRSPAPAAFTLPLASLEPESLAALARLLSGKAPGSLRAFRFEPPPETPAPASSAPQPPPQLDSQAIEQQLALFLFSASPQARRLLGLLTFAPVLTLPVVRLIQRLQLPGSGPAQIAEVLFSGLFRNVAAAPAAAAPRVPADRQRLVFVEEALRGRLREGLRVGEARAVFDAVKAHVAASLNCSVESFEALLRQPPPAGSASDSELLQAFATVAPSCLRGLGPRYDELADATEAAWAAVPQPLGQPQAKTLLGPEPFTLSYETAWLEEITLQPITFTTSVLDAQLRVRNSQGQGWALREPLGADGSLGPTMVQIPAGSFAMGSQPDEQERRSGEGPQHEVTLASFLLSQTPITQAQWREVAEWQPPQGEKWARELKPKPSRFPGDDRPVERVNWFAAMEFCKRLSQRIGRQYTLPSEAQWEYACRAATTMPFHFGATITPELVNYDGDYTYAKGPKGAYRAQTTSVASFPANAWGLHDMHGNVREWCLDHFHESYEGAPVDGRAWLDPVKAEEEDNKKRRLLRGGSWNDDPGDCRSAYRNRNLPDFAVGNVGFRVVCLPQGPSLNS